MKLKNITTSATNEELLLAGVNETYFEYEPYEEFNVYSEDNYFSDEGSDGEEA